jgi:hypothetical protein
LASAGTNLSYGISKGGDAASSAVWGAVSVAVSIVFALSWPALIRAIARREWTLVPMAAAALVLTGAYSVTAALGSASGGRAKASATEQLIADQRTRVQTSYATAQAELVTLKSSRPVAELEALLASLPRGRGDCTLRGVTGGLVCSRNAALTAELGRAKRRAELERRMDAAQAELAQVAVPKQANSDAAALAAYAAALGFSVQTDEVNRLLVLLAVLVVECGGGLALAVGMSLSERSEQGALNRVFANGSTVCSSAFRANTSNTRQDAPRTRSERSSNAVVFAPVRNCSRSRKTVGDKLIATLLERGGPLQTSIRRLAQHLGTTPTTLHTVANELMVAGLVRVDAGRQGSVFRLVVASRP